MGVASNQKLTEWRGASEVQNRWLLMSYLSLGERAESRCLGYAVAPRQKNAALDEFVAATGVKTPSHGQPKACRRCRHSNYLGISLGARLATCGI